MAKVDDKWFKAQGWEKDVYDTTEETIGGYSSYRRKATVWRKRDQDGSHARYEHVVETYYNRGRSMNNKPKMTGRSNFYVFNAWGNGFSVENRCSSRRFTDEQILSALKVVGLE